MKKLMRVLNEIDDSIDWENEYALIDDRIIDSFAVISLVSDLEDAFLIEIDASDIVPENFNSVSAIWNLVCSHQEK